MRWFWRRSPQVSTGGPRAGGVRCGWCRESLQLWALSPLAPWSSTIIFAWTFRLRSSTRPTRGSRWNARRQIEGGSFFAPKPTEVIDYYKSHDFTGVGQRIYDYALVLTGDTQGTWDVLPDSAGGLPDDDFQYSDEAALSHSMSLFLVWDVVLELGLEDVSGGVGAELSSDCTGQLH